METPTSVLVYRSGAVGDLIVTFPVLQAIRETWRRSPVTLVAPREAGELAVASGWADRLLSADEGWVGGWFSGDVERLRGAVGSPGAMLAFTKDEDGVLEQTARAAGIGRVLIHPPFPGQDVVVHMADHLLAGLTHWGIERRGAAPIVVPTEAMRSSGRAAVARVGMNPAAPYIVVHTGSSSSARNWPEMPQCAALLKRRTGVPVVLHQGPVEAERGIGGGWPAQAARIGPLPLGTLAGVLAGAVGYVGNDTGPSHLAAALGTATVTVFGRDADGGTNAARWAPRGTNARHVEPSEGHDWPDAETVVKAAATLINV